MEQTPLCLMLSSLSISPNRSQFFGYDSVSVGCEVQGNFTGWKLMRNTTRGMETCPSVWRKLTGSSCTIRGVYPSDSGMYWCESGSGEHSNTINVTVHDGAVILESPVIPVNEGEAVTLRCIYQRAPSDLTADFYKDGSVLKTGAAGEMTIPAVSTSDEGLYRCNNSELGESPDSWLIVKGQKMMSTPPVQSPSPAAVPLISLPRLLCSILVICPYLVVTILLLERCCKSRGVCSAAQTEEEKISCDVIE